MEYVQSCNCDYGCPCSFNGRPSQGQCEAFNGYRVTKGSFGNIKLDGLKFAQGLWWPKAIHEGNGAGRLYIDPSATSEQRKALEAIWSGQHGGAVWEIFPRTWSKVHPPKRAKISAPILNNADLLMISPTSTWPGFTKEGMGDANEPGIYRPSGRLNYTRVVPTDDRQAEVAAAWAKEMGIESVYILDDGEVYGRGIATMFEEGCVDHDIDVLGHESIDPKAQEFRSLMTKINAAGPDLVYFGGTTQSKGGQIAKDMIAAGVDAKLMVPDGCYERAFIEAAGAENLNDRCFLTFGGMPPDKQVGKGKEFVDRYKEKYGSMPEAYAIYAYEAARVALKAIGDAGRKDRRAIADAALAIESFEGALGTWSFDENGDTDLLKMSGIAVRNGAFEFVKLLGE